MAAISGLIRVMERAARKAYATDLQTGLPNRQQLIEHMSQLLALRGREPAPMALLVLRVEGFATTEARLGRESANVLRRKVAVRLEAVTGISRVTWVWGTPEEIRHAVQQVCAHDSRHVHHD